MMKIRTLIVDDEPLARKGLDVRLSEFDDIENGLRPAASLQEAGRCAKHSPWGHLFSKRLKVNESCSCPCPCPLPLTLPLPCPCPCHLTLHFKHFEMTMLQLSENEDWNHDTRTFG